MKTKIFFPYLIIQFILFAFTFFVSNGYVDINLYYVIALSISLTIPLLLTVKTRNQKDKLFGLLTSFFFLLGVIFKIFIDVEFLPYIMYLVGLLIVLIRNITESDKLFKKSMGIGPAIIVGLVLIKILNVLDWFYLFYAVCVAFALFNTVIMIILYYNGEMKERQNWFFGFAGMIIFIVWISSNAFIGFFDSTSSMYGMMDLLNTMILIPSFWIINLSFIFFEQREA